MDPISALGVAAAIVQFVDFATKLAYGTRQVYVSGSGAAASDADVELCASELDSLCARLSTTGRASQNADEEALLRLASKCKAISNELSGLLRTIKAKNPNSKWHCFVSAVKTQLKKPQRDDLIARLSECRAQLDVQLTRLASLDSKALHQQVLLLQSRNDAGVQNLLDSIQNLRDNVNISSLSPDAEAQLRRIFSLPEDTRKALTTGRVLNLLQYDEIYERVEEICPPHRGTLEWTLAENLPLTAHSRTRAMSQTVNALAVQASPGAQLEPRTVSLTDVNRGVDNADTTYSHSSGESEARNHLVHWLRSGTGIFHIVGGPESGKSTLMKYLSNHTETRRLLETWAVDSELATARYFLKKHGSKRQKSIAGLCRSVLFEILTQHPELTQGALSEPWKIVDSSPWQLESRIHIGNEDIQAAINGLLNKSVWVNSSYKFAIFIDGLSEQVEENFDSTSMIDLLHNWISVGSDRLKVCVATRPHPEFLHLLRENETLWLDHYNLKDMQTMVYGYLSMSRHTQAGGPTERSTIQSHTRPIADAIIQRAGGDFRWASRAAKAAGVALHRTLGHKADFAPSAQSGSEIAVTTLDHHSYLPTLDDILQIEDVPSYPLGSGDTSHLIRSTGDPSATLALPAPVIPRKEHTRQRELNELQDLLGIRDAPEDDLLAAEDSRAAGTCTWLVEKPSYRDWIGASDNGPKVLRIAGAPASGKSTLAGYVVRDLGRHDRPVSYFFFKHCDRSKTTFSACLRSIALQMAQCDEQVRHRLISSTKAQRVSNLENESERLLWRKLFLDGAFSGTLQTHYWVIDALDECNNIAAAFSSVLSKMSQALNLRILITSRETALLESEFSNLAVRTKLVTERVSPADTLHDIRILIQEKAGLNLSKQEGFPETVDTILAKSKGSFLWTVLVLKELSNAFSAEEVNRVLEDLPRGMKPLYHRTLDAMSTMERGKHLAKAILTWTACAARPLTLQELDSALKIDVKESLPDLKAAITGLCGQLVNIDKAGKVQMIHETAREFILDTDLQSDLAIDQYRAHARIAHVCLEYLGSEEMQIPRSTRRGSAITISRRRAALSTYVCSNFSYHLSKADPKSSELLPLLDRFLKANVLSWIESVARDSSLTSMIETSANFKSYIRRCRELHSPFEAELSLAESWSLDLVRISARFADALVASPVAIFSLIPALCPTSSAIFRTSKANRGFSVIGPTNEQWDDRLSCIDFRAQTSCVCYGHELFAVGLGTGSIALYHALTGQEYKTIEHQETVHMIAFLPGSDIMASGGLKTIKIWDVCTGEMLHNLESPRRCISLLFDQGCLIAACDKNYLAYWDIKQGFDRQPDKEWDTGSDYSDGRTRRPPSAISISLGHKMMAIAYQGRPIVLWDLEADCYHGICGKKLPNGETSVHLVTALIFNPNPTLPFLVASYLDGELVLMDPFDDFTIKTVRANCPKLAASPNGRLVAGAAGAGIIDVYGFESLNLLYRVSSSRLYVRQLAFSGDGLTFVDIRGTVCNVWAPAALRQAVLTEELGSSEDSISTFTTTVATEVKAKVTAMTVSCAGDVAVCGGSDGSVSLFDLRDGRRLKSLYQHRAVVRHVAYLPSIGLCMSIDASNAIQAFKIKNSGQNVFNIDEVLFRGRLDCDNTITQLLLGDTGGKFVLSTRDSDHLWTIKGEEQLCKSRSNKPGMCKWVQHPHSVQHVLCVEASAIRVLTWHDWSEIAQFPFEIHPTQQIKSVQTITFNHRQRLLVELCELNGGMDTRGLHLTDIEKPSIAASPSSEQSLLNLMMNHISHIVGYMSTGKLVFRDRQSWICSVDLGQPRRESVRYFRHFFMPYDWFSGNRDILCSLSRRDVVLARSDGIAIVRGGLDFLEEVSIPLKDTI